MFQKKHLHALATTTTPAPSGTDWIPEDATEPVHIEETAEAELALNQTFWQKFTSMFRHNKLALVSLIVIILFLLVSLLAPVFAPYGVDDQDTSISLLKPCAGHILGCDKLGRDMLSRMIYGSRASMKVAFIPTVISMFIGTVLGLIGGFIGGKVDSLIMRIADICIAFPSLLLAMVISYILGTGMLTIMIALSVVSWGGTARVIRSEVLSLREKEYVEAATSIGVKKTIIMIRHILPNCIPTLIVLFTMNVPGNILSEASLSFLGIGIKPPDTSWGLLIYQNKAYLSINPVTTMVPGIAILILVLAFNFFGDALRDKFDPRLQDQ